MKPAEFDYIFSFTIKNLFYIKTLKILSKIVKILLKTKYFHLWIIENTVFNKCVSIKWKPETRQLSSTSQIGNILTGSFTIEVLIKLASTLCARGTPRWAARRARRLLPRRVEQWLSLRFSLIFTFNINLMYMFLFTVNNPENNCFVPYIKIL